MVLDTAPATPPARKAAVTGSATATLAPCRTELLGYVSYSNRERNGRWE